MHEERNFLIHPQTIVLTLLLAGITVLFLAFSGAYLYSKIQEGAPSVQLPGLFYYNSLLLIASSFTLVKAMTSYEMDQTERFKWLLWITMFLTVLFLIAQIIAWIQMTDQNIHLTSGNMAAYLYVISGLHFAHVIAGIPFLGYYIWVAHKKLKTPVSVLIYFSDPDKKRKLKHLTTYWHFLDGLWIYLVVFFLVNWLMS